MLRKITKKLQYISDIHVDVNKNIPIVPVGANYLAICGDIGNPLTLMDKHKRSYFHEFLRQQSAKFEHVFFVPGNHDFDLSPLYKYSNVAKFEPILRGICSEFPNVHYLNCGTFNISKSTLIAGCTLWSNPVPRSDIKYNARDSRVTNFIQHVVEHKRQVSWLENIISENKNKKIVVLSHFVPSFQMIEPRFLSRGIERTSWFATNLEHLISTPVSAWISGHSHSILEKNINGVRCAINAYGYPCYYDGNRQYQIKVRTVDL